jgi:phenylacetate-CoA ligase
MSYLGGVLLTLDQSLRRSRSLAILREIESTPRLPRNRIEEDRFRRLSALLAEAEAYVPYYREMFQALGIRSRDIRNPSDFSRLPVLTKEIIRERYSDMVRQDVQKEDLLQSHTGGSTGEPTSFYHDRSYEDASEAATFRNLLQCGWKPGEAVAYFWGGNDRLYAMPRWRLRLREELRRRFQFDPFHSGPQEMDSWLERWTRIQPAVAFGYASTLARFAAHVQARGDRLPPLRGVFTTAEKLYGPQREVIAQAFGCHVYDCYGSSEVRNVGSECNRGRMHVNSDFVFLEVDDADAAFGEPAPFIVTSLWNRVMPFIRYRNEDCGVLLDGTCDCGNQFPLMDLKIARISDNFVLPSGRVVHGEFFTHLMYGKEGIATFQFHQTALDSITLWIVPGPGEEKERSQSIRKMIEQIKKLDPLTEIKVEVRTTEAIPLSQAGKYRFVRSDVKPLTLVGRSA